MPIRRLPISSSASRSPTGARPSACSSDLKRHRIEAYDLSDNEMAKLHVRHLVGGHAPAAEHEILYRFEFPERPGALMRFLNSMSRGWNISLFHYRNHGADYGRVLVGMQVPPSDQARLPRVPRRARLRLRRRDGKPCVPDVPRTLTGETGRRACGTARGHYGASRNRAGRGDGPCRGASLGALPCCGEADARRPPLPRRGSFGRKTCSGVANTVGSGPRSRFRQGLCSSQLASVVANLPRDAWRPIDTAPTRRGPNGRIRWRSRIHCLASRSW